MGQFASIALIWFIIEMLIWYLIAQYVSGWYVFGWFVIAIIIGISLIGKTRKTIAPMAQQMQTGGMPNSSMQPNENTMMKTMAMGLAGLLLAIPGVLSDVIALFVLLPPVQKRIKEKLTNYFMNNQDKVMQMMANQMGGQNQFGAGQQNPFGNMNGMGGNPFGGGQNPFGNMGGSPFANQPKTIQGTAKTIKTDTNNIKSANDD